MPDFEKPQKPAKLPAEYRELGTLLEKLPDMMSEKRWLKLVSMPLFCSLGYFTVNRNNSDELGETGVYLFYAAMVCQLLVLGFILKLEKTELQRLRSDATGRAWRSHQLPSFNQADQLEADALKKISESAIQQSFSSIILYWAALSSALLAGQSYGVWTPTAQKEWLSIIDEVPVVGSYLKSKGDGVSIPSLLLICLGLEWLFVAFRPLPLVPQAASSIARAELGSKAETVSHWRYEFFTAMQQGSSFAGLPLTPSIYDALSQRLSQYRRCDASSIDRRYPGFQRLALYTGPTLCLQARLTAMCWSAMKPGDVQLVAFPMVLAAIGMTAASLRQLRVKGRILEILAVAVWLCFAAAQVVIIAVENMRS